MMKKLKKKLKSQSGESLGETLVSLLIAVLALMMLAGAIFASSDVINRSRYKLDSYYSANEDEDAGAPGVVKMASGGTIVDKGIKITDSETTNGISEQSFRITYFKNDKFSKTPVVSYRYTP